MLAIPPSRAQAPAGERWALLIGVEQYERSDISRLEFAVKDVKAVASSLARNAGFSDERVQIMTSDVRAAEDPRHPSDTNILVALERLAEKVGPDDTFLFYFSGHGFQKDGETYLGAVNADPRTGATLKRSTVPVQELQAIMGRFRARQVIFIIDACRNDPEKGKGDGPNLRTGELTKTIVAAASQPRPAGNGQRGFAVLFACREKQRAFEDENLGQGVFTHYLLQGLQGGAAPADRDLTMNDLGDFVQRSVRDWAERRGKEQEPDLVQSGAARVVLAPARARRSDPVVMDPAPDDPVIGGTRAQVSVTSDPPGARIYLDGADTGKTAPALIEVDLEFMAAKQVEVGLKLQGRLTQVAMITLRRGRKSPLSVTLPSDPNDSGERFRPGQVDRATLAELGAELVYIPPGEFIMGTDPGEIDRIWRQFRWKDEDRKYAANESPAHRVEIARGYWLFRHEVTVRQFRQYCSTSGAKMPDQPEWSADNHPVVSVTWQEAVDYCNWLSRKTGEEFRLPTEAEWERAARGPADGINGRPRRTFVWGDDLPRPGQRVGNVATAATKRKYKAGISQVFENYEDEHEASAPVGSFQASAWNLHDMAGNVCEWCADWYAVDYYRAGPPDDPPGPAAGTRRVLRDGSWGGGPIGLRAAIRYGDDPAGRYSRLGFRPARTGL